MIVDGFHSLDALGPYGPAPHLAVGVSGGADSLALTLLAHRWTQAQGGRITALTVDHGLRAESAQEARDVGALLHARGIDHVILTPEHRPHSRNLQETARAWRYDALAEWCSAHDVLHCLLAHHAGDQRETVALHTARGDTADGASGMAMVRRYRGIRFLRPLLGVEKTSLEDLLRRADMRWMQDPSNVNPAFARVRARDALRDDREQCMQLTAQAAMEGEVRAIRDDRLAAAAARMVTLYPTGYAHIEATVWRALDPPLATQLLADLLTTVSGATHRPRSHETGRLADALRLGFTRRTLHGCEISLKNGCLRIAREIARTAPPLTLEGSGYAGWDRRFHVHYALPQGYCAKLAALGPNPYRLPHATPALWHLDCCVFIPHIPSVPSQLPEGARVQIGFAPAKPLAAAPFWWLKGE